MVEIEAGEGPIGVLISVGAVPLYDEVELEYGEELLPSDHDRCISGAFFDFFECEFGVVDLALVSIDSVLDERSGQIDEVFLFP